jgi:hypothetical protein
VVTGSKGKDVSKNLIKQANDQLFQFIDVLGDSIQMEKTVELLTRYDWQELFRSMNAKLTSMQNIIDEGDRDIVEVLKPLLEMMKRNTRLLNALQKENERVFGKSNTIHD